MSLNRAVALKMIKTTRFASDENRRRFQNEAEAVARLDHPNIVPIFEVGQFFADRASLGLGIDSPSLRPSQKAASRFLTPFLGRFHALPARAQAMYAPELRANSDEIQLRVKD